MMQSWSLYDLNYGRIFSKLQCGYVDIAEQANGPIPKPVAFSYIWGGTLRNLHRMAPDVRIINLETTVTTSDNY